MKTYIYKWKIKENMESLFVESWSKHTIAIRDECGSFGSRLHKSDDGLYYAYAQWSDAETRTNCRVRDPEALKFRALQKECIEISYPDIELDILADFLVHPIY